jgi:glycosyltransferase involved in cell wall biosynthesis
MLSVVIPTLNEEKYLPCLLHALRQQTYPPCEIIIADAHSSDRTRTAALRHSCRVVPGGRPAQGSNLYHYAMQRISPHASGFYIIVRKSLHDQIGGFNERLFLTEDHDYVVRAARHGKFKYLRYPQVTFSVRRFNKEGRARLVWKFFVLEIYRMFKEVRRELVRYEFGKF